MPALVLPNFNIIKRPGEPDPQDVAMLCDAARGCPHTVRRAPRIVIPSCTPHEPMHLPFKVMTDLHYCEAHTGAFRNADVATYLTDERKRAVEEVAKRTRPAAFRPDFDRATYELVLTTTPEYRRYLASLGATRVIA